MTAVDIAITTGVGADTYVYSSNPTLNYGALATFGASTARKPIIRFDLSSIPASATIVSATLSLYNSANINGSTAVNLFKVADANGDWVEGTATGQIQAGSPCWNFKAYNTVTWAGSVGLATAGTDYINTLLATATLANGTLANTQNAIVFNDDGLAVLQGWFGASSNNGFVILTANTTANYFHSKQASTEGYRPVLSIVYEEAAPVALVAADLTLSAVTFDAPVLEVISATDDLTAKDFTLATVTFDAPTLTNIIVTPPERIYTVDAESREYVIQAESREYVIEPDMRGVKIDIDSMTKFRNEISYNGLTGQDLTLGRVTFDAPILVNAIPGFDFSKLTYADYVTSLNTTGCTVDDLGASSDGTNHVYGLQYGDAGKPCVFLVGTLHGNEWSSAYILRQFMTLLAAGYNADFVTLVNRFQFYCIPVGNPYGYIQNIYKNANGVNLNQNFDYYWSLGDDDPASSDYRGTAAWSEAETVIIRDKFLALDPISLLDCHTAASDTSVFTYSVVDDNDWWTTAFEYINRILPDSVRAGNPDNGGYCASWARSQPCSLVRPVLSASLETGTTHTATEMAFGLLNFIAQAYVGLTYCIDNDLLPTIDSIDTFIAENNPTNNYGIYTAFISGNISNYKRRGLLKFSLDGLPAGSTITDATIYLTATGVSDNTSRNIGLHRCLTEWHEGLRYSNPPNVSEDGSTWNLRNANGSVVWGTGAGTPGGLSGTDYEATAAAVTPITGTGLYSWDVTDEIQAFVDGADNYGWFVINADEATNNTSKTFASNEATTGKPYMIIHYS